MVNIFIIKPDLYETARLLDKRRLGKQRVEAKQIIDSLEEYDLTGQISKKGWSNHPATKSWIGFTNHLKVYFNIIVREWINRGCQNNMPLYDIDESLYNIVPCDFDGTKATYDSNLFNEYSFPFWISFPPFYLSHQASLCRKDPKHYKELLCPLLDQFLNNGYLWPSNAPYECYINWNFSFHEPLSCGCPPVYRISTIQVLEWLKNPLINPPTRRKITESSQIYKDFLSAMENHGIVVEFNNQIQLNIVSIEGNNLCFITPESLDFGISILNNNYITNGYPTACALVYKFSK